MLQILFLINVSNAEPQMSESWRHTPELKICFSSKVEPELVRESLIYISENYDTGVDTNKIKITTNNFCGLPNTLEKGAIYIDNFEMIGDLYATTQTHATTYTNSKILPSLNYAYIKFPNNLLSTDEKLFILSHELGHALGMSHDDSDYLMRTYY